MNHWGKLVQSQILRNTRQTLWKSQERQETLITCARINYKAGIFKYIGGGGGFRAAHMCQGHTGQKQFWRMLFNLRLNIMPFQMLRFLMCQTSYEAFIIILV